MYSEHVNHEDVHHIDPLGHGDLDVGHPGRSDDVFLNSLDYNCMYVPAATFFYSGWEPTTIKKGSACALIVILKKKLFYCPE